MVITIQDGDTINVPPYLKPIIKDTYITFKKQPVFKNGDVLIVDRCHSIEPDYIFIYNGVKDKEGCYHYHVFRNIDGTLDIDGKFNCDSSMLRHATMAEKYAFFQHLEKENLKWNEKEYRLEYIRWRANKNEKYYYLDYTMKVYDMTETGSWKDRELYESGNYFRTKDLAELYKLELKSMLTKFHEEIEE